MGPAACGLANSGLGPEGQLRPSVCRKGPMLSFEVTAYRCIPRMHQTSW